MAESTVDEEWRKIPGFPDYSVSSLGRVRRDTYRKASPAKAGHIRKTPPNSAGYSTVTLFDNGRKRCVNVNTLVCETFISPRPSPSHEAAHWDGDPANNRLTNLRWATGKENMGDCIRHGRTMRGRKCHLAKLSEDDVRAIRSRLTRRDVQQVIADDYGINQTLVSHIKNGRAWAWLK